MTQENKENIWGKRGCELRKGKFCHACCEFYKINFGLDAGPYKQSCSPCPYQNSVIGEGEGCSLQFNNQKPGMCRDFLCEDLSAPEKIHLVVYAVTIGQATKQEGVDALCLEHTRDFLKEIGYEGEERIGTYLDKLVTEIQPKVRWKPLPFIYDPYA